MLFQELAPLARTPSQLCQQRVALREQIAAAQGHGHAVGVTARLEGLEGAQVGQQVGIGGDPAAAAMAEGPLQIGRFLGPLPAQPLQLQVDAGQFAAPVLRVTRGLFTGGWRGS